MFGIIGRPLGFSLSKEYFDAKFSELGLADECSYRLFPLENIGGLTSVLAENSDLAGFNVTIPYKREVMEWLDELSDEALAIGAVNCVKVERGGSMSRGGGSVRLVGYNTDAYGFLVGLERLLGESVADGVSGAGDAAGTGSGAGVGVVGQGLKALVLGSGGASCAVQWVLKNAGIEYLIVSREGGEGRLSYAEVTPEDVAAHRLIINTTPLGMFPDVDSAPPLPYDAIGEGHYLYDLVYNPAETRFLKEGARRGAATIGGETMLWAQAERNWEIWSRGCR